MIWLKRRDRHSSVFQLNSEPLGRTNLVRHDIITSSHPIKQPPVRFSIGLGEEGEKQIAEMLDKTVI